MKLIDLIKLSNYNVILFKDNHMQFANQKEKMSLENAYTENNTVVGDDYIKQFPSEVITKLLNERQRKPSGLPEWMNLPCFLF